MLRPLYVLVICVSGLAAHAGGMDVGSHGFDALEHDFGTVRRGAKLHHSFVFENKSNETAHIRRIRVSCNCVRAKSASSEIAPGERTAIEAEMDSSVFLGSKSVTIYVQFDQPRHIETALRIHAVSVVEIAAGGLEIDFGSVQGAAEKRMNLDYTGEPGWKITGATTDNALLKAEVKEAARDGGKVRYELHVMLDALAGVESFEGRLRLRTNDPKAAEVLIVVKAVADPIASVSPPELRFASLVAGEKVNRTIIIKASRPFRVERIENGYGMFEIRSSPTPKTTQLVVITLTAPDDDTLLPSVLEFVTNLDKQQIVSVPVKRM